MFSIEFNPLLDKFNVTNDDRFVLISIELVLIDENVS